MANIATSEFKSNLQLPFSLILRNSLPSKSENCIFARSDTNRLKNSLIELKILHMYIYVMHTLFQNLFVYLIERFAEHSVIGD